MHRYAITTILAILTFTCAASAETRIEITRGNAVRDVHGLFGESYRTITTPSGDTYLEPGSRMEQLAVGGMRTGIFGVRFSDPPPCPDGLPQRVLTHFRGFSCKPDRPQTPATMLTEVPRPNPPPAPLSSRVPSASLVVPAPGPVQVSPP